jgi:hypothetical protein
MAAVTDMDKLIERLKARAAAAEQGNWESACGVTEVPFHTKSGFRLLYCWQLTTGRHAYLNCDTDIILSDEDALLALGVTEAK